MPVAIPVAEPIVATATFADAHMPPEVASLSVVVPPLHITVVPVMGAGLGLTVMVVLVVQPAVEVYMIVTVPGVRPVNTPPILIVPTKGLELVHAPPGVRQPTVIVLPTHTEVAPVIGAGNGAIVTGYVA